MSSSNAPDPTFRSYSAADAKTYATYRLSYSQSLYDVVLKHHAATGGQFNLLLDVGCGPGTATRDVALAFDRAIGVDPGEQMIAAATELGGKTAAGRDVRYIVSPAEELSSIEVLEAPLFCSKSVIPPYGIHNTKKRRFTHPQLCLKFERDTLGPYELLGNPVSMNTYDDLPLPWDVSLPVEVFSKSKYIKHDYDPDGVPSNGKTFFAGGKTNTLKEIGKGLQTASMVTRWKAANLELVGTEKDVVKVFIEDLQRAMGGRDWADMGSGTAVLLFKKS